MNFKEWLILSEAIDATTKNLLAKQKAPQDQLDAFIKELEDEPTLIDKPTAFQRFQAKFNIQKKVTAEDAQRKYFSTIPNTTEEELQTYDYYKNENKDSLKEMMELLRKFIDKKLITLKFENNKPVIIRNTLQGEQKFDTPKFTNFTDALHQIRDSLKKYTGKGNYFNPIEEELNHKPNLVAKGDNIWVFKGHAPDLCRIYGKGHPWCISSSTSAAHWFGYRIEHHQTQYFVFDFNKDEDDPARYVNPGVSPEGMYSEWVDARNQHSEDPEDSESEVGINGYSSINEYKKYLVSKGVPLDTWKTTPPEDWEERLHEYDEHRDFASAKNDSDSRVFPMYLKIVNEIKDSDFDTLDKEQKIDFVMGKIARLTNKQKEFVKTNIKKSDYYGSLQYLYQKIEAANYFNDESALEKIASMPELKDSHVENLLFGVTDKDKFAEIIINNKLDRDDLKVLHLLRHATNKGKIAKLIINKKEELSTSDVGNLMTYATDKEVDKIAELIINKKPDLSSKDVFNLLDKATNKELIAELLQKNYANKTDYPSKLMYYQVSHLIYNAKDKDQMAKIIIKYNKELSDDSVSILLGDSIKKDEIAELIIEKKPELSDQNVYNLLHYANDKDKIAQIILNKKTELSDDNVRDLLHYANDKDKIAQIILNKKTELSDKNVDNLLKYATDRKQMAQIIKNITQRKHQKFKN